MKDGEYRWKDVGKHEKLIYWLKVFLRIEKPKANGSLIEKRKVSYLFGQDTKLSEEVYRVELHNFFFKLIGLCFVFGLALFLAIDLIPIFAADVSGYQLLRAYVVINLNKYSLGILFYDTAKIINSYLIEHNLFVYISNRFKAAFLISTFVAFLLSKETLEPKNGIKILKGMNIYTGEEAAKIFSQNYKGTEVFFGDFTVTPQQWNTGAVIQGQPGSGKTSLIKPLVAKMFAANEKTIVLDIKGDFIEEIPRTGHDYIMAPWLISPSSIVWDVAKDIDTEFKAVQLAEVFFPLTSGKEAVWDNTARTVVAAAFKEYVRNSPGNWDMLDVSTRLGSTREEICKNLGFDPSVLKIMQSSEETAGSVELTIVSKLEALRDYAQLSRQQLKLGAKKFSITEWSLNKDYKIRQIFFRYDKEFKVMSDFLFRAIIDFFSTLMSKINERETEIKNIIIDEAAQLEKIKSLPDIPALGRSKKIRCIIAFQLMDQMIAIYGEQVAKALYTNSTIKIICKTLGGEASESIAKSLGQIEYTSWKETVSQQQAAFSKKGNSGSQETKTKPAYLGSELATKLGIVSMTAKGFNVLNGKKIYTYRPTAIRALLIANHYYEIDFKVVDFEKVDRKIRSIPSTEGYYWILKELFRSNKTIEEKIKEAKKVTKSNVKLMDYLYSEEMISIDAYKSKDIKKAVLELQKFEEDKAPLVVEVVESAKETVKALDIEKELEAMLDVSAKDVSTADATITAAAAIIDTVSSLIKQEDAPLAIMSESSSSQSDDIHEKLKRRLKPLGKSKQHR